MMNREFTIPEEIPLVPMKGAILFPGGLSTVRISGLQEEETDLLKDRNPDELAAAVSLKKNFDLNELVHDDFFPIGTLSVIEDKKYRNGEVQVKLRGLQRIRISRIEKREKLYYAVIELVEDRDDLDEENRKTMADHMKEQAREIAAYFEGTEEAVRQLDRLNDPADLMYSIIPYLNVSRSEKQELLEMDSLKERGLKVLEHLVSQKESLKIQAEMAGKISEKANKTYRENILREQLKVIQKELHEGEGAGELTLKEKIDQSAMPKDVRKTALKELEKLEGQPPGSPDTRIIRNYLDLMLELPWESEDTGEIDLDEARRILNTHHYGLEKVKKRIIQHLAVMKLKNEKKGSILLLVGPPGTGKTSLGRSIAESLNRQYVRISLGGVRDEAEIRGHRRTYVGALPGRIIQGMKKAGTKNPVFVLDEVDKLMQSFSGDPAGALLEVLDPEQNNSFSDHYLEVPYDLSDVFFIATANTLETIPAPLRDRMEIITLSGYTNPEKIHIGQNHLIPAVLEDHGLTAGQVEIGEGTLAEVVVHYTREAGVRELKRKIAALARGVSEKVVAGKTELPVRIGKDDLEEYLENGRIRHETAGKINPPGVVTGMAWTPAGGEILFIESTHMPGSGGLTITGQLGDVMKESARISLSLIRSRLSLFTAGFSFQDQDIHIHVPSGAVPKDGPSAGVALLSSLASLITGKPVNPQLAMTGEVTLRGAVMPVGGIREKVLAAHRAGIRKVILPAENSKDLKELPEEVREDLEIIPAETIADVLREALGIEIPETPAVESSVYGKSEPGDDSIGT